MATVDTQAQDGQNQIDMTPIINVITDTIKMLVNKPDLVNVNVSYGTNITVVDVTVDKPDVGLVIGSEGRTIGALRVLATGMAHKYQKRLNLNVID